MSRARSVTAAFCIVLAAAVPRVVQAQTTDAEAQIEAGNMHIREGRSGLAVEALKRAVKADPKSHYAYKSLGIAYMQQRDYGNAIAAMRRALELNPHYSDVRNDLGTALILSGKRSEGKAEYVAVLNDPMNPTPEMTARNLAQAYFEERNYGEAASWFQTSIGRNKAYAEAYVGLADALLAQGQLEAAIHHLETGAKETGGNACLLVALGSANLRAGRFTDARTRLDEALRKDPSGPCGRSAQERLKNVPR